MVRNFKFFEGFTSKFTVHWGGDVSDHIEAEQELTNMLSQEIARTIDEQIINRLLDEIQYNQRA